MKNYFFLFIATFLVSFADAQDNISPAKSYAGITIITNANIHTGTGTVLQNTSVKIVNGKIELIGRDINAADANAKVVDATGMEVYPGFILSNTNLGLHEIANQIRGTDDYTEIGDLNPNVRSLVAYNTESKITNVIRSNGILLANITPRGSLIAGSSSVVQLDAWNWEDAAYKADNGMHFYMPSLVIRPNRNGEVSGDALKNAMDRIESVKQFFREAKAYNNGKHTVTNLKLESVKGLFDRSQKLFIHCNAVKEMLSAIDFVNEFNFDIVIVGGSESWRIAELLRQNNIAVILNEMHALPVSVDDDIDQPFKTPFMLQQAGVLFAINDDHEESTFRNLMFNAGTAAAYGLTKEQALTAITLNAAKILGVDKTTGSIEVGKDANLFISTGDALDMRTNNVIKAFIQGRDINLDDKGKQLYKKYADKYGVK